MDTPDDWQLSNRLMQSAAQEPSFHSFSKLPIEIRLEIWKNILPGPRLIQVHYDVRVGKFWTTTPSPAKLLVCSESRYEMLKEWPLRFATRGHSPLVRANLDIDTVRLSWNPLRLRAISQEDLCSIISLEVGGKEVQRASAEAILQSILTMPNLKDFSLVSPALCDIYPYSLSQQLSQPHVGPSEEENWLLSAQRLGYEARRNRAFYQHTEVTRCFRAWARENPEYKLPRLRLLLSEPDGSRSGSFFWKP